MKTIFQFCVLLAFLIGITTSSYGQKLGPKDQFVTPFTTSNLKASKQVVKLDIPGNVSYNAVINHKDLSDDRQLIMGEIQGAKLSSFYLRNEKSHLEGHIIFQQSKKAYKYYSDSTGNAFISEVDINSLICIDYLKSPVTTTPNTTKAAVVAQASNDLQSLPGAAGCLMLDCDGQYVSGTPWNGGNPINAAPSNMTDAQIQELWELVSEDYRPFNVNVTTSESVFNTYPKNKRRRCILTPTNTAAPGAGGVAYLGSFTWNDDTPCWVFELDGKAGGEASSHELGHTFGLSHDGRTNPVEGYYAGQGDWAPIMGVGYYKPISQWSKGEYNFANNFEDDVAIISSTSNGVGFRADDHGNSTATAAALQIDGNGNLTANNTGIIENQADWDFFSFNTKGGNINLNVNTVARHGDLDIIVRLYQSNGTQIGEFNPSGLNSTVTANLASGNYFLSVDGTGAGNPATDGYSDYASLGSYFITGNIPVSCAATAIIPYLNINNLAWQQTSTGSVAVGGTIVLGPQPADGTWSWSGPNGYSSAAREITISNIQLNQSGVYTATYTNACGAKSSQGFNITVTGGCASTAITAYQNVNNGGWQQATTASVPAGGSIIYGPQPTDGTWSWSGPNGFSSSSREITISNLQTITGGTYTATYTNACGAKSTQGFTVTVTGGCAPTAITAYLNVNNSGWQQVSTASLAVGGSITFGPQPTANGTWNWGGPFGFTSSSREVTLSNIQASQAGTYTATYTNTCGGQSTKTFVVNLTGAGALTVANDLEIESETAKNISTNKLSIYPNPVETLVKIQGLDTDAVLDVYSITGEKIITKVGTTVDVSTLKKGIYLIRVTTDTNVQSLRFIKR